VFSDRVGVAWILEVSSYPTCRTRRLTFEFVLFDMSLRPSGIYCPTCFLFFPCTFFTTLPIARIEDRTTNISIDHSTIEGKNNNLQHSNHDTNSNTKNIKHALSSCRRNEKWRFVYCNDEQILLSPHQVQDADAVIAVLRKAVEEVRCEVEDPDGIIKEKDGELQRLGQEVLQKSNMVRRSETEGQALKRADRMMELMGLREKGREAYDPL
jgi:hypothetical protein